MKAPIKNCGSCKFLDVPTEYITKNGTTNASRNNRLFPCSAVCPIPLISLPACIPVHVLPRTWMAPTYGEGCTFHVKRKPIGK